MGGGVARGEVRASSGLNCPLLNLTRLQGPLALVAQCTAVRGIRVPRTFPVPCCRTTVVALLVIHVGTALLVYNSAAKGLRHTVVEMVAGSVVLSGQWWRWWVWYAP